MTEAEVDPPFVRDLMMGVDGEAPACQPPTSAPSPHGATVDAVQCGHAGCAGAMCTAGWCKCARGVVLWRGWGAPLKGAALGPCQTRPSGDIRRPGPQEGSHWSGLPDCLP